MKIQEVLKFLQLHGIEHTFTGNAEKCLDGFSSLTNYRSGTFTWIKAEKNIPQNFDLGTLALVFTGMETNTGNAPNVIRTAESKHAFFATIEHFYDEEEARPAIGQHTYIGPKVKLGKGVRIGHNCTLDGDITIGDHTVIWNNVTIVNRVSIGAYCEIQSGVIIGHSSLAYTENEQSEKFFVKHYGGVRIGDHVYLAKGVNVDQGTIDDTVIESWCAIDCKSAVSHNCRIGRGTTLAMQCMLGGSTHIGCQCYLSRATTREQTQIGDHAKVGMGSIVTRDIAEEETVVGYPARRFLPGKE